MTSGKGFLFDTSILSVLGPFARPASSELIPWVRRNGDKLYVPVIALLEIERGASKLLRAGAHSRAVAITDWLEQITASYGERILPVNSSIAREAGRIEDDATAKGRHPGLADILIAATASAYGLAVLTANVRHFEHLPVIVINPLSDPLP